MIAIVNKQVPEQAIQALSKSFNTILFETNNITYRQISNHPDVFFCKIKEQLIAAPNTPEKILLTLQNKDVDVVMGDNPVGASYPVSARYNAVVTDRFLIHNLSITDPVILKNSCHLEHINVSQGYTRCSLLPLKNNRFITSDRGIEKTLFKQGLETLYVNPVDILLPGFKNGFFGGTAGVIDDRIFFTGSLNRFYDGEKVKRFLQNVSCKIIELSDGPLFDAGTILFV